MSNNRDTVWERSDGVRVRLSVRGGNQGMNAASVMILTPYGIEHEGAVGERFTLVGSVDPKAPEVRDA